MSCIKTGANVYFHNYGILVRGDVFKIGNTTLIRWNPQSIEYNTGDGPANLVVSNIEDSNLWWHREDIGVTVVPEEYCYWWSK